MNKKIPYTLTLILLLSSCTISLNNSPSNGESEEESTSDITSDSNETSSSSEDSSSSEESVSNEDSASESTSVDETYKEGFTLTWHDEFSGSTLNSDYWTPMIGDGTDYGISGWGNNEAQWYTSNNDNLKVQDGNLVITAVKETYRTKEYTSARLRTAGKVSTKYGYIEARMKLPAIQGMWPAFWMLPESGGPYGGWASSGEIDIMEARGRVIDGTSGALHYGAEGSSTYQSKSQFFDNSTIDEWHTYAIDWDADFISWYVDDEEFFTIDRGDRGWFSMADPDNTYAPFDWNFHILLNLAVGGNFDGGVEPPSDFEYADMMVDYVRIYKYNG